MSSSQDLDLYEDYCRSIHARRFLQPFLDLPYSERPSFLDTVPEYTSWQLQNHKQLYKDFTKLFSPNKKSYKSVRYFITFTYNPSSGKTKEEFKSATLKQLSRKIFTSVTYAFEHEDSNIHCHAIAVSTHHLSQSNFTSHIRKFGHVDIKHVTTDNGLLDYISKESTPHTLVQGAEPEREQREDSPHAPTIIF